MIPSPKVTKILGEAYEAAFDEGYAAAVKDMRADPLVCTKDKHCPIHDKGNGQIQR